MAAYDHVIWDFHGTLFDDSELCIEILNEVLKSHGLPLLDRERYEAIFTFPVRLYYEKAGFTWERFSFKELGTEWFRIYEARLPECSLRHGARETLRALHRASVGQSILSALQQETLSDLVTAHGLDEFFGEVIGIDGHLAEGKLAQGKRHIARLGHNAARVLFVGDTGHDYEVAKAIGVSCALVPSGHQSPERLAQWGAPIIRELSEVLDLVRGPSMR